MEICVDILSKDDLQAGTLVVAWWFFGVVGESGATEEPNHFGGALF